MWILGRQVEPSDPRLLLGIQLDKLRAAMSMAQQIEVDIMHDGEEPALKIAVRYEPAEGAHGSEVGFLNQVFRLTLVSGEGHGIAIERVEVFERYLAERLDRFLLRHSFIRITPQATYYSRNKREARVLYEGEMVAGAGLRRWAG